MKCPNCGNEIASGASFCTSCGTQVEQEAVYAAQEPVYEEAYQEAEAPAAAPKKLDSGLIKKIAIVAVAVVAVIILASLFKSCGGSVDLADIPVLYASDDETKFLLSGDKEGKMLGDGDDMADVSPKITADGKYIFFGTDPDDGKFDLCFRDTSKKDEDANVTIVKGITSFKITPDGNTVFYIKKDNLYKCPRKKEGDKSAVQMGKDVVDYTVSPDYKAVVYTNDDDEVYYSTGVEKIHNEINDKGADAYFSEDGKKIRLVESKMDEETYETKFTIYVCGTGKNDKAEKLESNVDDYSTFDSNYSGMYFIKKDKLYYKDGTKEASEVDGLENDAIYVSYETDEKEKRHFYAVTCDETDDGNEYALYYVDGKKAKLLLEKYDFDYDSGDRIVSYEDDDDETTYYFRAEYDKYVELDIPRDDDDYVVDYAYTENSFYTIENVDEDDGTGDLVKYDITSKGVNFDKGKVIAEDVADVDVSYADFFNKETIFVEYDDEEYAIYNGKLNEISDIHDCLWIKKDGTRFFATDYNSENGTYTLSKYNGKELVTIAEDVRKAVVISEDLIYYINEDDELIVNKGKSGKDTMIDEDVHSLTHPISFVVFDELDDDAFDAIPLN